MVYEDIIQGTPDYQEFLTVDELNASSRTLAQEFPDLVEHTQLGVSTNGEPIYVLKVKGGEKIAVLIGFPHPNEPIGSLTIEYLSRRLAEDDTLRKELGFTWYFIKAADCDGARLNEGWFKEKYDNIHHVLNFYRTPVHKQVEWTFPIEYKTLKWNTPAPETKVVMDLIHQTRPDFVYSLHNAAFGGVYYYVSDPCPPLYPRLQNLAIAEDLPLHLGEPEMPYMGKLSDAIFILPPASVIYEFYVKHGENDPATLINRGTSAMEYAKRVSDAFTIICEMPYIYDPKIVDISPSNIVRREAVLESVEIAAEIHNLVQQTWNKLERFLDASSPFYEVTVDTLKRKFILDAKKRWAETDPSMGRPATISELFDSHVITKYYSMRSIGHFIRLIDQSKTIHPEKLLEAEREMLLEKLHQMDSEINKESAYEVIPIQKLVKVQVGTALNAVAYLNKQI